MPISGNLSLYIVAHLKELTLLNVAFKSKNSFHLWNDNKGFIICAQIFYIILGM